MGALVNKLIGTGHHPEHVLVHNDIRSQQIHQREQIIVAGLQRGSSQHYHCVSVLAEVPDAFVCVCLVFVQAAITNMMRFVDNHEIKMRSGIKIQQAILSASAMLFAFIDATIQNGIWQYRFIVANRPLFVSVCIGKRLPESSAIQRNEILIKALHLHFPFSLCDKRFRTDDQDIIQLASGLQFLDDQTGFDCFTDTNAVCNKNLRLIRFYELERRPELIRDEINSGGVE